MRVELEVAYTHTAQWGRLQYRREVAAGRWRPSPSRCSACGGETQRRYITTREHGWDGRADAYVDSVLREVEERCVECRHVERRPV